MFKRGAKIVFRDTNRDEIVKTGHSVGIPTDVMISFISMQPLVVDEISKDGSRVYIVDPRTDKGVWWMYSSAFRPHCMWGEA